VIVHIITGLGDGGAEGVLYRLCKHDMECCHVVISLMQGGQYAAPLRELGVPVHELGLKRGRIGPGAVLRLRGLLKQYKPDVVQTWLYHADLLGGTVARLMGVPHVSWGIRHGELAPGKTKRMTIAIAHLCARLSRRVPHAIVSCSFAARDIHVRLGYDAAKFRVIPNGYEIDKLVPDLEARKAFRSELAIAEDVPLLGMVSRFHPQKDHPNLFQALALLAREGRKFQVALVGTGMTVDNEALMALAGRLGVLDRIHMLGRRNDVVRVMNGLDLHVLSSASEGFPNVAAEAMFCGTPCVVTRTGDSALVAGPTGWVAEPGDPVALASAIAKGLDAIGDAPAWQQRKAAARRYVLGRFSIGTMVAAYHRCWDE